MLQKVRQFILQSLLPLLNLQLLLAAWVNITHAIFRKGFSDCSLTHTVVNITRPVFASD